MGARRAKIVPTAAIAASLAVLLLFFSSGNSLFGLVGKTEAETHNLEVKYMFKNELRDGDAKVVPQSLQVYDSVVNTEISCEFCSFVSFTPGFTGTAGLTYSDIVPHDMSGSQKMTLMIMGAKGGEQVSFDAVGKVGKNNNDIHFAVKTGTIKLTKQWNKVEMDLRGVDLSSVTHPLKIDIGSPNQKEKVEFYIKHVLFDTANPVKPIPSQRLPQ